MNSINRSLFLAICLLISSPWLALAARPEAATSEPPDPATVERSGNGYRYPKAGWIVLHIEGEPYERGYQHGRLLAPEIADYIKTLAGKRSTKDPAVAWRDVRTMVNALFLRGYDKEYVEEMKGIADGAAAAGAKFDGRPLDFLDIVSLNTEIEIDFLDSALDATATGLEGKRFPEASDLEPRRAPSDHCSAFAANGPATADGSIVFGHITMWNLTMTPHFNVWLDIKPAQGHRILMQTYPGSIMSGMDYYLNDAGLLVAETTIHQTKFAMQGTPLASRIRKTLQYANSIDTAVAILKESNNGMYSNEWLLADINANEIAMFELGTHKSKLWRSSKDEWYGGTKGFYWGCNNAKDLDVRLETVASVEGKPANLVFHPADRDRTWLRLFDKYKGKITADFGFEAFTTPPLCAAHSCDAKFTTTALAKDLKSWALFGPPLGKTWEPTIRERAAYPPIRPLIGNDWTLLTPEAPSSSSSENKAPVAVDLASSRKKDAESSSDAEIPAAPAWHGTLLPRSDGDVWLAAAFADYERIVAREKSDRKRAGHTKLDPVTAKPDPALTLKIEELLNSDRELVVAQEKMQKANDQLKNAARMVRGSNDPSVVTKKRASVAATDRYQTLRQSKEQALREKLGIVAVGTSSGEDSKTRDRTELALFGPRSHYRTAVERWGTDVPLVDIKAELNSDEWYQVASGKGVLLLAALREKVGDDAFLTFMDRFGREHAGQPVSTDDFRTAAGAIPGHNLKPFFDSWLKETGLPTGQAGGFWSIDSYEAEPEKALIVYGTVKEATPQREAAERLARAIAMRWSNVTVPVVSDQDAKPEDLKDHHVLLVGRPDSNAVAAKYAKAVPLQFGPASFVLRGETYAHPGTAVIAAGSNPLNPRYELVLFAGLSAEATWRCVENVGTRETPPAEVLLLPNAGRPRRLVVPVTAETKSAAR
jgi:hypothetical protein